MKKYIFSIANAQFTGPKEVYTEVEHKILNESTSGIIIKAPAENINQAMIQADQIIAEIILSQFANYPNIQNYKFLLEIKEIEVLTA